LCGIYNPFRIGKPTTFAGEPIKEQRMKPSPIFIRLCVMWKILSTFEIFFSSLYKIGYLGRNLNKCTNDLH